MADPSRTASVGDGRDGLKRVGLPASAHQRHLEAPDHTTLSRRSQHLDLALDRISAQRPVYLIVDSTGRWCTSCRVFARLGWCRQPLLSHNSAVNSKVHPKYKTQYRVGNWQAYERALVQRGDITLWFSANAIDAWRPSLSGLPGGPRKYSDVSIETALTLRLIFHLPLRQTEGFLAVDPRRDNVGSTKHIPT